MKADSVATKLIDSVITDDYTYLVRELGPKYNSDAAYEVAKFAGSKEPSAVYTVTRSGARWYCDCLGFRKKSGPHKHVEFVKNWIAKGKPDPITTPGFQGWANSVLSAF